MVNDLGQPTTRDVLDKMCSDCNAVICAGCPAFEIDKNKAALTAACETLTDTERLMDELREQLQAAQERIEELAK